MVRAWQMCPKEQMVDQRAENRAAGENVEVTKSELLKIGVEHIPFNSNNYESEIDQFKQQRGYTYSDKLTVSKDTMPDYETKIRDFFNEHLHADEEVRFILDGSGYFDVRSQQDDWIRIEVVAGDALILPAGIYHRFTLDQKGGLFILQAFSPIFNVFKDYIRVIRLFAGDPVWTPLSRPVDEHPARKTYLQTIDN